MAGNFQEMQVKEERSKARNFQGSNGICSNTAHAKNCSHFTFTGWIVCMEMRPCRGAAFAGSSLGIFSKPEEDLN